MARTQAQFDTDISLMTDIALNSTLLDLYVVADPDPVKVVQQRREHPTDPDATKDLLDRMLTAVDTKTGEKMSDESIVDNVHSFPGVPQHLSDLDSS